MRIRTTSMAGLTCAALVAVAAPAVAQQATPGLRYLGWSGKPDAAQSGQPPQSGQAGQQGQAPADGLRRYPGIIPRQVAAAAAPVRAPSSTFAPDMRQTRYSPTPANRLTPASAWTSGPYRTPAPAPTPIAYEPAYEPAPQPQPLPQPAYRRAPEPRAPESRAPESRTPAPAPTPLPAPQPQPQPQPVYSPPPAARAAAPVSQPRPDYLPQPGYAEAPVPALAAPQPGFEQPGSGQPASEQPVFDPMAPRRDAPIFRMGSAAAAPSQGLPPVQGQVQGQGQGQAPTAYAPSQAPREGARYYSVHRAAGHQPDATVMPESVYLDTAPIDLAEPPETPIPARTVNGRAQNIIPNEDPSLP